MVPLGGVMLRALANVSGGTLGEGIECGLHKGCVLCGFGDVK